MRHPSSEIGNWKSHHGPKSILTTFMGTKKIFNWKVHRSTSVHSHAACFAPLNPLRFFLHCYFSHRLSQMPTLDSAARMLAELRRAAAVSCGCASSGHVLTVRHFSSAAAAVSSATDSDPARSSSSDSKGMHWFRFFWWILHVGQSGFLQCWRHSHQKSIFFQWSLMGFFFFFLILKEKRLNGCCFYLGWWHLALGPGSFLEEKKRLVCFWH